MIIPALALMDIPQIDFPAGEELIRESTPGARVFVLIKGCVSVEIGGKKICDVEKPGAVFGEISCLLGKNHTASVITAVPSRFFVMDDLPTFIRQNPEVSIQLLKVMAERLVNMNRELVALREKSWWKFWW